MQKIELADRLRRAREAAGLSIAEAATRLGFGSYQILSNIEKGDREVKANELALFAKAYFCNLHHLLLDADMPKLAVQFLWREAPSERKIEIEAEIRHRFEEYHFLETLLGIADEKKGYPLDVSQADCRNNQKIDDLAIKVSNLLNLGSRPALSIQKVMEQVYGTKILFIKLSDFGSAASTVHPEFGAAIVVNSEEAPWRINFTLAHELFHIITWHAFPPADLETDVTLFREIEKKADRFASTLLLPNDAVKTELVARVKGNKLSLSDIVDVAREFGVSTQALLYRMANIHLIEWAKADALAHADDLHQINRQFRRDGVCSTPTSERFLILAVNCLRKGLISRGKFSELLEIDRADIDIFLEQHGLSEVEGESIEIMAA